MNENVKENGFIPGMNTVTQTQRPQNIDIKLLHAKKQQAEMRRNQKEEDLRENHPYFDRPLFAVPRESTFRRVCQAIVNASYDARLKASFLFVNTCLLYVARLNIYFCYVEIGPVDGQGA